MSENIISEIRTQRLVVRRVTEADAEAFRTIWEDFARSEYACYDRACDTSDAAVAKRIKRFASLSESNEHMFFAVCFCDAVTGYIDLHLRENNSYEIGYCFHSRYHGNGYAYESVSALTEELRKLGADKIIVGTALKNFPSVKLLYLLGFELADTEKVSFYKDADGNDIFFDGGIFELSLKD